MQDGKEKIILHVVSDTLFFDSISERFDALDGYKNIYLFRAPKIEMHDIKRIRQKEKLIYTKSEKEWGRYFALPEVNIVFFHGLFYDAYKSYKYISEDKKVIWWTYGKDLYEANKYVSPLLDLKLYKKVTGRCFPCFKRKLLTDLSRVYGVLRGNIPRKRWIKRVDYCSTVFPIEYVLLKQLRYFRAEPFMLRGVRGFGEYKPVVKEQAGDIIVGHSATYTDNHLDVIEKIKHCSLHNRKVIMPINYGYEDFKAILRKYKNIGGAEVIHLEKVLPRKEYFELVGNCTHAIFGAVRQQAVGNINGCMKTGVKVFLFKDSMDYKQFKQDGYIIYSIEDDLNQEELDKPLSREEVYHNWKTFYAILGFNNAADVQANVQKQFDSLYENE